MSMSRREFIVSLGAAAAVSVLPAQTLGVAVQPPLYPPTDLSCFDRPITRAPDDIRFGYAAITWDGNDAEAIKDISEIGFRGIQLRSNILKDYGVRPKALRDLLDRYHLEMVALSSGGVAIATGTEADEITKHVSNARFVHEVGGLHLQLTDSARPKGRKPESADFKQLGRVFSDIGKRAIDLAVPVGSHHPMGSPGAAPDEVDRIVQAVDPS